MTVPYKPRRACSFPGCPRLTPGQYCGEHKKKIDREYNLYRRDDFSRKFYNSPEWKKLRNLKLSMNTLCEHCEKEGKLEGPLACGPGVHSVSSQFHWREINVI